MPAKQLFLSSATGSYIWRATGVTSYLEERWSAEVGPADAVTSRLAMNHRFQEVFWEL
jgi:hypothetical protein